MTFEEVIKIIEKASELGLSELEIEGLKVKFDKNKPKVNKPPQTIQESKHEELVSPLSVLDELSPEEILYYATPEFDRIQAEKEAHKQKLKAEGL